MEGAQIGTTAKAAMCPMVQASKDGYCRPLM